MHQSAVYIPPHISFILFFNAFISHLNQSLTAADLLIKLIKKVITMEKRIIDITVF